MCLFNLVEQDDRIRASSDLFGQLSCLVISHIAGRRTDNACHAVLFHKFGHIQTNQRILLVEQLLRQRFDQLGLADTGRSYKDEGSRTALFADLYAGTSDSCADQADGFVLPDDAFLQRLLQICHPLHLRFLNLAGGDAGPQLDDLCQILVGHLFAQRFFPQAVRLSLKL